MSTKVTIGALIVIIAAAVVGLMPMSLASGAALVLMLGAAVFTGLRYIAESERRAGGR